MNIESFSTVAYLGVALGTCREQPRCAALLALVGLSWAWAHSMCATEFSILGWTSYLLWSLRGHTLPTSGTSGREFYAFMMWTTLGLMVLRQQMDFRACFLTLVVFHIVVLGACLWSGTAWNPSARGWTRSAIVLCLAALAVWLVGYLLSVRTTAIVHVLTAVAAGHVHQTLTLLV